MSLYTYNGVTLQYCRTLEYRVEPEYDPTNTDVLWNKYTIRVKGFVSSSQGQFQTDTPVVFQSLKDQLEAPRRDFTYRINATNQIVIPVGAVDAKIGPHPMPAVITEVTSGTFMVEHGVVCRVVDCDNECATRNPIVSLRWTQTESFDVNWNSTLSTSGRLIVRSDLLQSADNFRSLATPTVLPNYQRQNARYTLSPDGLQLDFSFEDKEVDRLPPFPATTAAGSFTVACEKPGYKRWGTVEVTLTGQAGTSRRDLMVRAVNMCYSKLDAEKFRNLGKGGAPSPPIMTGTFVEDLFTPTVKVSLGAMLPPLTSGGFGSALKAAFDVAAGAKGPVAMPSVGVPPAGVAVSAPGIAPPDRKRIAALLTAAFRDPCECVETTAELRHGTTPPSFIRGLASPPAAPSYPVTVEVASRPPAPTPTELVTDTAPYDTYQIENTTTFDTGRVQMPGTGVGPDKDVPAIVVVHGGITQLTVAWVAGRTGAPPVLPAFASADPNLVPLRGAIVAKDTTPSPDGANLVYMVAGYYVYAVMKPKTYEIGTPAPPFMGVLVKDAAAAALGAWTPPAVKGDPGANPFVPGGAPVGVPPTVAPGFDQIPPSTLPLGGFQDLGGGGDTPAGIQSDPFFNPTGSPGSIPGFNTPHVNP